MKTILNLFGKSIIVILYWSLVTLFVWLFYDEYITEHTWSSICMSIASLSFGCALHGMFISWLYKAELKGFELQYKKMYNVIVDVVSIVSFIFLGIFVVSALMGILGNFVYTFISGVIIIICRNWVFCFLIMLLFLICIILKIFKLPIIRAISKLIYRIALLSSITLIIYIEIDVWRTTSGVVDTFIENCLIAGGVTYLFLGAFLLYLFYDSVKMGILSLARLRYVLFLRSFKDDNYAQSLYNEISKSVNYIPLIKIGNPEKSESENINEHYLPLSNWKFFLKYYISKAKAIITVVSSTNGLIWEMTQNMKYLNKSIIIFTSTNELTEFKNKLLLNNNGELDVLTHSIDEVIKNRHYGNAFILRENKIYIGSACVLIDSLLKDNFNDIKQIELTNITSSKTATKHNYIIGKVKDSLFRHFHILGFVNYIESIHNNTLKTVIKCLVFLIGATFYIIWFLMGVGMSLFPLIIWFGHNIDWLGISYEDYSTLEKVLMSWFSLSIGIGFIKELFRRDN